MDFFSLGYYDRTYRNNDDLTLWRLAQFDERPRVVDSEYDRFNALKSSIHYLSQFDGQYQIDMNNQAVFETRLQEFYDRILLREAVCHSDTSVARALEKENEAWQRYHTEVNSSFRIIDGDPGLERSSWTMAISGIALDDAQIREKSLSDFYFALADSLDYSERHSHIPEDFVIREYNRFIRSIKESEYNYSVQIRRKALSKEMEVWEKWMNSRSAVSSLLTGLCKKAYDNSTNNVRRMKLIMLKNRYSGYGIISGDVWRLQIPYSASDEELEGPSFDERWDSMLDSLNNNHQ